MNNLFIAVIATKQSAWVVGGRTLLVHALHATRVFGTHTVILSDKDVADDVSAYEHIQHISITDNLSAVKACMPLLQRYEHVLIVDGHVGMLRSDSLRDMYAAHLRDKHDVTLMQVGVGTAGKGIEGHYRGCGLYRTAALISALQVADTKRPYMHMLSECATVLRTLRRNVGVYRVGADEMRAARTKLDLYHILQAYHARNNALHMLAGVTMYDSNSVFLEGDVSFGADVTLLPNVILRGKVHIGAGSIIGPNVTITDSRIGGGCTIIHTVIAGSTVGDRVTIGPFAYLRPGTAIADDVRIGDFVEIKNSNVGTGSKVPHLSYVGDADVGERVNIGCGVVTANYDGKHKHRTVIEDGSFVGCNTNLVAPVTVHSGAFVAAGSTITDDVPPEALAIARARQVVKERKDQKERKP